MKMIKFCVFVGLLCVYTPFLCAGGKPEKHWQEIQQRLEKAINTETESARKSYLDYVQSLSGPDLLATARAGAQRLSKDEGSALTRQAAVRLYFFTKYYPRKTADLKNIQPLLVEVEAKEHVDLWRKFLINLLADEWRPKLETRMQIDFINSLVKVLANTENSTEVRGQIPTKLLNLLADLGGKVGEDESELSRERVRNLTIKTLRVFKKVLEDGETEGVCENVLSACVGLAQRDVAVPAETFNFLDKLLADFDEQPEGRWFHLARYAFIVHGQEALPVVKKMKLRAARDKTRKALKWLLKKRTGRKSKSGYRELWGPPCGGLVMSAGVEPRVYEMGERIEGWIAVRGTSAGKRRVVKTDIMHDCRLALYTADGRAVRRKKEWWIQKEKQPAREPQPQYYELSGKSRFYESFVVNNWFRIEVPGIYYLVVTRRIGPSWQDGYLISNLARFKISQKTEKKAGK